MADVKPRVEQVPPPANILGTINSQIESALNAMPEGAFANAVLKVETTAGINLAMVAKIDETWTVMAWAGKRWGAPVEGGVAVQAAWK